MGVCQGALLAVLAMVAMSHMATQTNIKLQRNVRPDNLHHRKVELQATHLEQITRENNQLQDTHLEKIIGEKNKLQDTQLEMIIGENERQEPEHDSQNMTSCKPRPICEKNNGTCISVKEKDKCFGVIFRHWCKRRKCGCCITFGRRIVKKIRATTKKVCSRFKKCGNGGYCMMPTRNGNCPKPYLDATFTFGSNYTVKHELDVDVCPFERMVCCMPNPCIEFYLETIELEYSFDTMRHYLCPEKVYWAVANAFCKNVINGSLYTQATWPETVEAELAIHLKSNSDETKFWVSEYAMNYFQLGPDGSITYVEKRWDGPAVNERFPFVCEIDLDQQE